MLNDMARTTPEVLAPQFIYTSLHASNEKERSSIVALMRHFGTGWGTQLGMGWRGEMRRGLIPLLETTDEQARKEVSRWLFEIDGHNSPKAESNVLSYRETLLRNKKSPPPGLVNYVYDFSPSLALLLFGDIYSEQPKFGNFPRPLMWSDHVVTTVKWRLRSQFLQEGDLEKAQKELNDLSKHEGWYVRRYVVEVAADAPKLVTAEITERLKKDNHPLVRERVKLIK